MKSLEPIDYVPSYSFWVEGCATFAKSIEQVMHFAGEEWTLENFERFLRTIPTDTDVMSMKWWQEEYFNQCCKAAYAATRGTSDEQLVNDLLDYFMRRHVQRSWAAKSMLHDSVLGVLLGAKNFNDWEEMRCKVNKTTAPVTSSVCGRALTFWRSCVSAMRRQ